MKAFQREARLRTAGGLTVTDITEEVREAVRESGIRDGICCVYSPHTTCAVRVNELGARVPRGLRGECCRRLVPTEHYYAHDDWDHRTENVNEEARGLGNGHFTACRCCSARPASRCLSAKASCASAPGSGSSSSSSTASATAAGSSKSSACRDTPSGAPRAAGEACASALRLRKPRFEVVGATRTRRPDVPRG